MSCQGDYTLFQRVPHKFPLMNIMCEVDKWPQTAEYVEQREDRRREWIMFMTRSQEEEEEEEEGGARAERRDEIIGGRGVIVASRRVYHPERDQVLQ